MRRNARWMLLSLVLLPAVAHAEEPGAAPGRNALTFGVGLGFARVDGDEGARAWALRLRAVAPVAERVELGVELLTQTAVFESLSSVDVAATYYPAAGFFLRGGVGASRREELAAGPWFGQSVAFMGANALAGLGYALGGTRGLAASLNLEAQLHVFDRSSSWERKGSAVLWLGLDWR